MIQCSFCENPLVCKSCGLAFQPFTPEEHQALYQPEMVLFCSNCQTLLICRDCGHVYAPIDDDDDETISEE